MSLLGVLMLFNVSQKQLPSSPTPDRLLASHSISMENRYGNSFVNGVFKNNILLTLYYLSGRKIPQGYVDWNIVDKPFTYKFTLKKGQTFAFHDTVLADYAGHVALTTHAHFNSAEGFQSDGYLVADGVCHLASLIDWAARDAGLTVVAPTNHNFAEIPEVPREYGVAIYDSPDAQHESALQNLYITNTKNADVMFVFQYDGTALTVSVTEK